MKIEFCISFTISRDVKTDNSTHLQGLLTRTSWKRRRRAVRKRDKSICQYCGEFCLDGHVDHILPLSKGGMDDLDNLAWACAECNQEKGSRVIPSLGKNEVINIWSKEKPSTVTVNVMSQKDEEPAPFELLVTMEQLREIAEAVIKSGDNLSRRSLCDERRIITTKKHPKFMEAMQAAGLVNYRGRGKNSVVLTESGLQLLTSLLSDDPDALSVNGHRVDENGKNARLPLFQDSE